MSVGVAEVVADLGELNLDNPTDRAHWLNQRRAGIGGSDVGKILGVSRWGSPLSVWQSKLGPTDDEQSSADAMIGRRSEPMICDLYEAETGRSVNDLQLLLRHPEHPWMLANVDRVVHGEPVIVEAKARRYRDGWDDGPPLDVYFQCMAYLAVTGFAQVDVAVLFAGFDLELHTVDADTEVIDLLIDRLGKFWSEHVETGTPPPPTANDSMRIGHLYPGDNSRAVADPELEALLVERVQLAARIDMMSDRVSEIDVQVKDTMRNATSLWSTDGRKLATWSPEKERTVWPWEAPDPMVAGHPDLEAFARIERQSRRFAINRKFQKTTNQLEDINNGK